MYRPHPLFVLSNCGCTHIIWCSVWLFHVWILWIVILWVVLLYIFYDWEHCSVWELSSATDKDLGAWSNHLWSPSELLAVKNKSSQVLINCPQCGLMVRLLDSHIMDVHTPDHMKTYQCPDCGKGFSSSTSLKTHRMNVHLKLRPYRCRYGCEDSYNDTSNRNSHEKKKHGKLFTTTKEEKEKRLREECAS